MTTCTIVETIEKTKNGILAIPDLFPEDDPVLGKQEDKRQYIPIRFSRYDLKTKDNQELILQKLLLIQDKMNKDENYDYHINSLANLLDQKNLEDLFNSDMEVMVDEWIKEYCDLRYNPFPTDQDKLETKENDKVTLLIYPDCLLVSYRTVDLAVHGDLKLNIPSLKIRQEKRSDPNYCILKVKKNYSVYHFTDFFPLIQNWDKKEYFKELENCIRFYPGSNIAEASLDILSDFSDNPDIWETLQEILNKYSIVINELDLLYFSINRKDCSDKSLSKLLIKTKLSGSSFKLIRQAFIRELFHLEDPKSQLIKYQKLCQVIDLPITFNLSKDDKIKYRQWAVVSQFQVKRDLIDLDKFTNKDSHEKQFNLPEGYNRSCKQCLYCLKEFESRNKLYRHLDNELSKVYQRQVNLMDDFDIFHNKLVEHMDLDEPMINGNRCGVCSQTFSSRSAVVNHQMKFGNKFYECYLERKDRCISEDTCYKCLNKNQLCLLIPCGDNICLTCVEELDKCPVCQTKITNYLPMASI